MKPGRFVVVLALTVGCALFSFVPAGTTETSAEPVDGALSVSSFSLGDQSVAVISVAASEPIAHVRLSVPTGYTVDLGRPAGTPLGFVSATLYDVAGTSSPAFADGELVVADPATYLTDPVAQACAPGRHAAVWRGTMSVLGQTFELPIFLDPAGPTDSSTTAFVLQFCPAWSSTSVPGGVVAPQLSMAVENVLRAPSAPGRYVWSALTTPLMPASLVWDSARAFELRAVFVHPYTMTLRARHDAKTKSVVLSGKLTAVGEPVPGVPVSFAATTDSFADSTFFGPVRTNAAGEFTVRRHVERTTLYSAAIDSELQDCTGPSSAPAGCVAETSSTPPTVSAIVKVRKASDPKLAGRARDQARARRINLKLSDFPAGWEAYDTFPPFACAGFKPRLSDLTVTGESESRAFASEQGFASSRAAIYVNESQARTAFQREARLGAARCLADELEGDGAAVLQLRAVPFPLLGSETRAFRVVSSYREDVLTVDLVSFRRGRTVVHLGFASAVQPLPIAQDLAAKVAARATG